MSIYVQQIRAATIILIVFVLNSRGLPPPFCTNWNTGVQPVCTAITLVHNFLNAIIPPGFSRASIRHCNFLLLTPHCCEQFCTPAEGGECEQNTGACRCQGPGVPETCNMYFNSSNPRTNPTVLGYCEEKCKSNSQSPETCTTPSYVNDGLNFVCVCYCSNG